MIINCLNWKPSDKFFRGTCSLGMFKGIPSFGECVDHCIHCQTKRPELDEYIKTQAGKPNEPEKPCSGCGEKVKHIVEGFGRWGWDSIASLFGGRPDAWVVERAEICAACEYRTFLPVIEWAAKGIDLSKIIKLEGVFADADLPIDHEPGQLKMLWCAKCKCCLKAAIRAKDKRCTLNKWPLLSGE